jgi:hypothetical protein
MITKLLELLAASEEKLTAHVHDWNAYANNGNGGRTVELRYVGAYSGPLYSREVHPTTQSAEDAAALLRVHLGEASCRCATCSAGVVS